MKYSDPCPIPSKGSINTQCHSAKQDTMLRFAGRPNIAELKCSLPTVAKSVGPFKATGFEPFLDVLAKVFAVVEARHPELYQELGSAGCLNVRKVRGGTDFSNHAWGTAIDLTIDGVLCQRGSGHCQLGLLRVYECMKSYAMATGDWLYWGAGFNTDDCMHMEASEELIRKWKSEGKLG